MKRITILLLGGAASVAAFAAGSLYLVAKSKPQSEAEYRAERLAEFQKKQDEDMERLFKEAMSSDRPEKEKRYAGHEYRMFTELRAGRSLDSMFQPGDGIDEFEALLLAKSYFSWQFGACGGIDMPARQADLWVVQISSGREGRPESPIFIDARTGAIRCDGHPSISDPVAFIRGPKTASHFRARPPRLCALCAKTDRGIVIDPTSDLRPPRASALSTFPLSHASHLSEPALCPGPLGQFGSSGPIAGYRSMQLLLKKRPKIGLGVSHVVALRGREDGAATVSLEHVTAADDLFVAYGKVYIG